MIWGVVATVAVFIASSFGIVWGMYFNAKFEALENKVAGKLSHAEVSLVVKTSLEEYHKLFGSELKKEFEEKHQENKEWQMRLERKNHEIYQIVLGAKWRRGTIP